MNHVQSISPRVLVTGAAGFVGSHLCERLLRDGSTVIGVDNFYTGSSRNILPLQNHSGFSLLQHDVSMPYWVNADQVYNLACAASPKHYQSQPVETMKTSFLGGLHALEIAKASNARVLQASTSEVYGDPLVHPQPETYWGNVNPHGARSCYDEGKRSTEALFYSYRQLFDLDTRIARIFNTYGPRMRPDDGRVVSNFIVQALQGKPITIYGEGTQTRSFCYVDDLVEGLFQLMNCDPDDAVEPINLGNCDEFTILELAEIVLNLSGSKSEILFHDLPSDDPKMRRPNNLRAKERLGWKPNIPLKVGLSKTIDYFDLLLSEKGHDNSLVASHPQEQA
ncbi:MAG: UDP-glucuronic acid decarboxylase family protein, partial [Hyphomicrobiales bacterium]